MKVVQSYPLNAISDGWFIDKLNMYQVHQDELPFIGKNGSINFDLLTGETSDALVINGKHAIQASYSTSVRVHCNGSRVFIEGNPSRFGRMENLFGFQTIDDCVAVYNQILAHLGLPPFTTGRMEFLQGYEEDTAKKTYTGAHISHVDITKNHIVGEENTYAFLRAVSTLSLPNGKLPHLFPNGATLEWNKSKCGRGSSWDYSKIYIKLIDLLDKMKSNTKEATPEDIEYYKQVIEHCQYNGIIREEHSFKSDKLKRYDLQYYGITKLKHLTNHHTLTTLEKLIETLEVSTMDYTSIAQQLLDSGVCRSRQSANSTQSVALEWMNDVDFNRKTPKNTQFYEHKRRLLSIGLDISIPFRTDRNVLPMIRNQREIVRYSHDTIPAWYRAPKTQIQQLKIA